MRRPSIPRWIPVLLSSVALVACEGAAEPELYVPGATIDGIASTRGGNPLLGSWRLVESVDGDDVFLLERHFDYILTFRSDGTYSTCVSGDADHLVCQSPHTSCSWTGTYTYTLTSITTREPDHPDPDERGPDSSLYAIWGGMLFSMDWEEDDTGSRIGSRITLKRTGSGVCRGD